MARLSAIAGDYSNAGTITDRQQITAVGGEAEFDLIFIEGSEEVYVNGMRLMKGPTQDYTTGVNKINLTTPLTALDELLLIGRASSNDIPFSRSVSEAITLTTEGQTEIVFTSIETEGIEIYVSGPLVDRGRLTSPQDYELRLNSYSIIDLTHSYPAGTTIEGIQGGRLSFVDADSLVVNDGETSKSLSARFAETQATAQYFMETNGAQLQELFAGLELRKWRVDYITGLPTEDNTGQYPVIKLGKAYWNPGISGVDEVYQVISWSASGDVLSITASKVSTGIPEVLTYYRRAPDMYDQVSEIDYGSISDVNATQVKHRRGTQSEIDNFTPAIAEIVVNATEDELVLGDGSTQGGVHIPKKSNVVLSFDTLYDAVNNPNLKVGYSINLKERTTGGGGGAVWDVVSGETGNGFDIVAHDSLLLQLKLRVNGDLDVSQAGVLFDFSTENRDAIARAAELSNHLIFSREGTCFASNVVLPDEVSVSITSKKTVIKKKTHGFIFDLGRYGELKGGVLDGNGSGGFTGNSVIMSRGDNSPTQSLGGHQLVAGVRFRNSDMEHIDYPIENKGWQSKVRRCLFDEPINAIAAIKWPDEGPFGGNRSVYRCYSACPIVNVNACDNGFIQNNVVGIGTKGGDEGIYFPVGTVNNSGKVVMTGNRLAVADANITIRGRDHVFSNNICAAQVTLDATVINVQWSSNDLTLTLIDQTVKGNPNFIYHTQTYSPTFRSTDVNALLGDGILKGVKVWDGMKKLYRGRVQVGSTTSFGTGEIVTDVNIEDISSASELDNIGTWVAQRASGQNVYNGVLSGSLNGVTYTYRAAGGNMNAGFPWTWAVGDVYKFEIVVRDFF